MLARIRAFLTRVRRTLAFSEGPQVTHEDARCEGDTYGTFSGVRRVRRASRGLSAPVREPPRKALPRRGYASPRPDTLRPRPRRGYVCIYVQAALTLPQHLNPRGGGEHYIRHTPYRV